MTQYVQRTYSIHEQENCALYSRLTSLFQLFHLVLWRGLVYASECLQVQHNTWQHIRLSKVFDKIYDAARCVFSAWRVVRSVPLLIYRTVPYRQYSMYRINSLVRSFVCTVRVHQLITSRQGHWSCSFPAAKQPHWSVE